MHCPRACDNSVSLPSYLVRKGLNSAFRCMNISRDWSARPLKSESIQWSWRLSLVLRYWIPRRRPWSPTTQQHEARCLIWKLLVDINYDQLIELLDMGRPGPGFRNKVRESSQSNATDHSYTSPVKKNRGMLNSDGDRRNTWSAPKGEVVQYPVGPKFKWHNQCLHVSP